MAGAPMAWGYNARVYPASERPVRRSSLANSRHRQRGKSSLTTFRAHVRDREIGPGGQVTPRNSRPKVDLTINFFTFERGVMCPKDAIGNCEPRHRIRPVIAQAKGIQLRNKKAEPTWQSARWLHRLHRVTRCWDAVTAVLTI